MLQQASDRAVYRLLFEVLLQVFRKLYTLLGDQYMCKPCCRIVPRYAEELEIPLMSQDFTGREVCKKFGREWFKGKVQ